MPAPRPPQALLVVTGSGWTSMTASRSPLAAPCQTEARSTLRLYWIGSPEH